MYNAGLGGKRVLALGESHYASDVSEVTEHITNDVIGWYLDPGCEFEGWMNTYTKFIRALSGDFEIARETSAAWWNRIAFYNFVQVPMTGPRTAPTAEEFRDSDGAFFEILEMLRPDYVLAWGERLYNNLPQTGYQGDDCCGLETWVYETKDGHKVHVLGLYHPSAGFDTTYWRDVIKKFIG
jgi:uracil-DNA glycosylase